MKSRKRARAWPELPRAEGDTRSRAELQAQAARIIDRGMAVDGGCGLPEFFLTLEAIGEEWRSPKGAPSKAAGEAALRVVAFLRRQAAEMIELCAKLEAWASGGKAG